MSGKALGWAFEQPVSGNTKLLLLTLADWYTEELGCFPSIAMICKKASMSHITYTRSIQELERLGLAHREPRITANGRTTTNFFILAMEPPQNDGGCPPHMVGDAPQQNGGDHYIERNKERNTNVCERFEEFYKGYPRKGARANAEKSWKRLSDRERKLALAGLSTFDFPAEQKYTPLPATWLNQRRWEDVSNTDDIEPWAEYL